VPIYDYDPTTEPGKYAREVDVAAAPDGTLYAAFITDAPADDQQCLQSVKVFRSTDLGQTWQDDGLPAPDPPAPPCDQPRQGCRIDQLMDPIITIAADGYPRLATIWIQGCGSSVARAVRGPAGWTKPQSLVPIHQNMGVADGSYAVATADGNEYYGWSTGLPIAFGGEIMVCPNGDCSGPITNTISSRVEFGGVKLFSHPAGGAAVVYSIGMGIRTMLFYRHILPDGTWGSVYGVPITDLYATSMVALGLRAFSLAFVPGHPEEAVAVYAVNVGGQLSDRASYLAYRRTTDSGATWSATNFMDGSHSTTGSGEPQYEILQFPVAAANPVVGRIGVLYQMRDVHQNPSWVQTYLQEYENGGFAGPRVTMSADQPSTYPSMTGAWRFGEYNGLAATMPDPCYLGAWQSVSEVNAVPKGLILTRLACQGDELLPFWWYLPYLPIGAATSFDCFLPYLPISAEP
jgi:hypothetical protein